MKNLEEIRERYLRESFSRRLGHLASDLARISSFLDNDRNKKVVKDILEESKFFIEWTALNAPSNIQIFLSEIQSKLALFQRHLLEQSQSPKDVEGLKESAKIWSMRLVEFSGFVE